MKIKVNIKKFISVLLVSNLIVCMVACNAMPVKAAGLPVPEVTSLKLIDMCLTRSGKVVNSDIRDDVLTQTRNVLNDTAQSYWQWCRDNGKEKSVETFREYLESDAYASLPFRLAKFPLNMASFINWIINGETLLDVIGTDVNDVLMEYDDNGNVTVPSESVNIINQSFDNVKGEYTQGWRYEAVTSANDLPLELFGTPEAYEMAKQYINSSDNVTQVFIMYGKDQYNIYFGDNTKPLYYVQSQAGSMLGETDYVGNNGYQWTVYDENWQEHKKYYLVQKNTSQFFVNNAETFNENADSEGAQFLTSKCSVPYFTYKDNFFWSTKGFHGYMYINFGKEGTQFKVYDNLDAIKNYSLGNTPYYLTNRQYQDSVDNSFNVSGEYLQNNGGNFSYEQIREQINNSNVTNDNSANSIINDYSQTIINNYNYSSGDNGGGDNGGGGNDSGNDGNSILDGLGSIISALADIVGFLLGVIGDVIGLVGNLFTTIFEGIKALGSIFGGFSTLLGEIFVFIPQELVSFLVVSIEAVIGIAIWKKFSSK